MPDVVNTMQLRLIYAISYFCFLAVRRFKKTLHPLSPPPQKKKNWQLFNQEFKGLRLAP